jgi:putative NIF3 family GTP cyclohydrolase 1 type 2
MKNDRQELHRLPRRGFLTTLGLAAGATILPGWSVANPVPNQMANKGMTIDDVISVILKEIPGAPFKDTVDTIKAGDGKQEVKGIVTTMFATVDVIRKTAEAGANFIIAHEPTFYNHLDDTDWLQDDPVYQAKRDLLSKHGIVVWRFHDYWHSHRPDGVLMGVLTKMGWDKYYNPENPRIIKLPDALTVNAIATLSKKGLGIKQVRVVGNLQQSCLRVALLPGAAGGRAHLTVMKKEQPDLLIVGEVNEWETAEYVRDANALGRKTSLIVLGHSESEEPGMDWLVPWLQPKVSVKVRNVPSHNPFVEV